MANSNSRRHARKVTLDAAVSNAIAKAVDARKVAAFTVGAAGVLAGAAFAFGATPAMAAEVSGTPDTKPAAVATGEKAVEKAAATGENAGKNASADEKGKDAETGKADKKNQTDVNKEAGEQSVKKEDANKLEEKKQAANNADKKQTEQSVAKTENKKSENPATTDDSKTETTDVKTATYASVDVTDRASNTSANQDLNKIKPNTTDATNTKIEVNENNAGTMPNMYGWGSSDNTFSEDGEKHTVTFHFAAPKDGKITNIAIFPAQNNGLNNDKSKKGAEYYSGDANMRQSFSGTYEFKKNDTDGSADLTMSNLFSIGKVSGGAEKYVANRSIFVYVTKNGKEDVAYKTNAFRAATIVTPKTSGSVVLKYDQPLTKERIQAAITAAANVETTRSDKMSVNDQIVAASKAKGVNTTVNGKSTQIQDTLNDKLNVNSDDAYDAKQFAAINTETSVQGATDKTYVAGAQTLNTYMVTDLGFKSQAIPLTVARYDTRIDKPIVEDPTKVSEEVKTEIKKKLARLNNVSLDQVTINDQGEFTINFAGVDPKDAPKIALRDLVLKQLKDTEYTVPSDAENSTVKAVIVANPLGYSTAELKQIKKAIYEANKENKELGLSATDYEKQISLSYLTGNLTATGSANRGISNGQAENKITVKIKTDKAVAEFTSDVKANKLTRLPNIRTDYDVTWTNNKIADRDTDEGLSWSEDGKTIIYRYDPTAAQEFDTTKILNLLKATVKDKNSGLRDLTGNETLDHEGVDGKAKKSHVGYVLKDDQPTNELTLGNMSGGYWQYKQNVDNSGVNLGDSESNAGSYSWDEEAKPVVVAAKGNKVYKARLFVLPYTMAHYQHVYLEQGRNPGNTAKAINVIFVPQTNHKKDDLKASVDKHAVTQDEKKTPTDSAYYNASDDKKAAYDEALKKANEALKEAGNTEDSKLSEELKARIDNATIRLDKARAALDGAKTDKTKLEQDIKDQGTAASGNTAASGTYKTDKYKNVTEPSFLKDGKPDTDKNTKAAAAKTAYDEALTEAEKVKADANATQKAVDEAKAKLDAARKELDNYSTNKDKLNAAIAEHGHVNTGDATQTDPKEKLKTADPTYQNSSKEEREAYDAAVKKANDLSADPDASQKDVNDAITALEAAKKALDAKATNKAKLAAAVQQTFDNPEPDNVNGKKSTFYQNALNKQNNGSGEEKTKAAAAIKAYDDALRIAKEVLASKDATQKQVEDAEQALVAAEDKLHNDYLTDKNDLTKALADNIDGYLKPAYFNAFDKAQAGDDAAKQAFKEYNDAYQKAKALKAKFANTNPADQPTDEECKEAKEALDKARQVIDTYATDTSKLSAAFWNDIAIQNSPAYKNAKALVDKTNPTAEEQAQVEAAKKIKKAYDDAVAKLHKAFSNTLDKDKGEDGADIPVTNIPDAKKKLDDKDYLKNIQKHANGEPLDRDVTDILTAMNDAADQLKQFATKTDKLQESINKDTDTQKDPAYKNAKDPHKLDTHGMEDTSGYDAIKEKATAYDNALKAAKALMIKPDATQEDVNAALKTLDEARKALEGYKTNVEDLKKSVEAHGSTDGPATKEGTVTSDVYRNASDPHFLTADGKPDDTRNNAAKEAKKAYDAALLKAQDLLKKADPDSKTPLDAQPIQKEIDAALTTLNEKRKALDDYKTDTSKLDEEAKKSTAEGATVADADFEATPEFKNAKAKTSNGVENTDVTAYKKALKDARGLLAKKDSATLSERPTQKQINDALDALKQAKKQIEDNYKTDTSKLEEAKKYAEDVFKKTPEYKNALAKKEAGDQTAISHLGKDGEKTGFDNVLKKVTDDLNNDGWKGKVTQKFVDKLLEKLQEAQDNITKNYKTDVTPLSNEVGDKDQDGKPVTPKFEASVAYKNALEKAKTETGDAATAADSATKKLEDYNKKLKAAQDLIAQVNSTDPNADQDKKPTQKDVDDALDALKKAKQAIADAFKTNASALKNEADDKDEHGNAKQEADKFENSTEYQNALAKTDADGKKDVQTYKDALKKANDLLELFNEDGTPKANIPDGKQIPSQQEVDEAQKALKEIKDKILKNYVTSPHDLQQEFDKSKDGDDDKRNDVFENTPEFKNADAKKGDDGTSDNDDMVAYKKALEDAKKLLEKFDRTTGKPKALKAGEKAPTQKDLDDALKALQDAKSKIEKDYATKKEELKTEADADADFTKSPEYVNAQTKGDDASKQALEDYKKALEDANNVLKDPNATQAQVDDALKKLQDAKKKLTDDYGTSKYVLREEHSEYSSFESSPGFINAISNLNANPDDESAKSAIDNYKKALEYAKSVLDDPNATQAQVDAALSRLRDAKDAIARKYATDKKNLKNEHDSDGDFENSPEFQNAIGTPEADAYKKALEDAKKVLDDPNATQAQVDEALKKLREAKNALVNGHKTNKADLQNESDDDPVFRNGVPYLISGSPEVDDYKKALDEARRVLADPNATQAQVDAALRKLREAKQRIIDKFNTRGNGFDGYVPNAGGHEGDGYANNANANANAVDKSALQAEINSALNVRGNSAAAQAYKNALAEAKRVLADANATQAQVDAAVKQLRDAKAAFNGFGGSDHHLAKTGAGVGLFAGLAAIFAGFGAAGVASRRRKHSNE